MGKRIKILFTISNFNTAGSGKVVYDLVKGLDKTKFDVEIACGNNKGDFFKVVQSLGVPIHIFQTKTSYHPYITLFGRILNITRFYKNQKYDLIHSWQWSSDWTEALAAKLAGVPWIYTKKAMGFKSRHWKIKSFIANYIITINEDMQEYFPSKKKICLIPLGLDTNYYNPKLFNNLKNNNDFGFNIITVANLVPVKGIEILIEALKIIDNPDIALTIIGDDQNDYGNYLKQLIHSFNLEGQVFFLGKQLDIRYYLSQANLYVIPTLNEGRKEGMPMALVEAMSMGVPVLGSDISGINYVLKDFKDYLFKPGSSEELSEKIKFMHALGNNERKKIGNLLRIYCIQNFSQEVFLRAHEMLYLSLK